MALDTKQKSLLYPISFCAPPEENTYCTKSYAALLYRLFVSRCVCMGDVTDNIFLEHCDERALSGHISVLSPGSRRPGN